MPPQLSIVCSQSPPVANESNDPIAPVQITDVKLDVPMTPGMRTIKARWKRGKCDSFMVEAASGPIAPNSAWQILTVCAKASCEVTLTTPGQWAIRVVGVYAAGHAEPSIPVSFMIG